MKISEYRQQKHPEHLIAYLEHIEWGAGKHLAERLRRGAFTATYGESAELHIAEADGKIIGFGAITEQDYLPRPQLKPWISFLYIDPKARGQRLSGKIIEHLEQRLRERGISTVYLATQHHGLYEKYGYTLQETTDEGIHDRDYLYHKKLP